MKQYKIIDKTFGEYNDFKAIQKSVADCRKVAEEYKLENYIILEREVTPWKKIWSN